MTQGLNFFEENPPDLWEECACCGGYHPPLTGPVELLKLDCRNDLYRWPSKESIAALQENPEHGYPKPCGGLTKPIP